MPHASHGLFGCGAMMSAMSTLAKLPKKCDHAMRASAAGARPQDDETARRRRVPWVSVCLVILAHLHRQSDGDEEQSLPVSPVCLSAKRLLITSATGQR